ncbi:hypothetical protein UlMin_013178 [Ulmus minor]
MRVVRFALLSFKDGLSRRFQQQPFVIRTLSTNSNSGGGIDDNQSTNSFESADDFERRIFDSSGKSFGDSSERDAKTEAFFQKLDRLGKAGDRYSSKFSPGSGSSVLDGLDESFDTLQDGMEGKLEEAATYFEFDPDEMMEDDYSFRPDMNFDMGMTYTTKDLDLTKPGVRKPRKRAEFTVSTEEVLRKADFRNVRFLANFLTVAGILIKRSQTGISAKAQRKVAREIKTARAFGLMPFTTMGTKPFVFGKTMEDLDEDYEYESFNDPILHDAEEKDPLS